MTAHPLRLTLALDPLIAEAKRRVRQRRVLAAAFVLFVGGGAGAASLAASPSAVSTGPLPIHSALVGSSAGGVGQPNGPVGVYAPRFGIALILANGSRTPVILERVRVVLGADTGPHIPVGQIGARFKLWKPPPRCVSPTGTPCTQFPTPAARPMAAERPTPLRLAPGHAARVQLNFRLLGCSRRQAREVVSLQKITAVYRLPNGTQIEQHPPFVLTTLSPVLRDPRSLPRNDLAPGPVGEIATRACHR